MTQIMKPHMRQTRLFQKSLQQVSYMCRAKETAIDIAEHNPTILPFVTRFNTRLLLVYLMLLSASTATSGSMMLRRPVLVFGSPSL